MREKAKVVSIRNSGRCKKGYRSNIWVEVRNTALTFLVAAAAVGPSLLLRAQGPFPPLNTDSRASESRHNSDSAFQKSSPDYVIRPDDQLEIYVLDVPEVSRVYRVSPSGSITLALLPDPILAAGLTPAELSSVVVEKLRAAGMVGNPHVTVQVRESRVHSIAVLGAVKKPQIYPLFSNTTLLDVLSQAEGLSQDAGNTVIVTRGETAVRRLSDQGGQAKSEAQTNVPQSITVDLKRLLEDGDTSLNIDLYPGDRVTVQRAGIVYVVGGVNRAGGFLLKDDREQMTVLKAVALAESLKSTASPSKAIIIRKNPQVPGATEDIPVDLSKILTGHRPDRPLLASDILFVPESGSRKALHRAGEAAAQAAALFIYRVP